MKYETPDLSNIVEEFATLLGIARETTFEQSPHNISSLDNVTETLSKMWRELNSTQKTMAQGMLTVGGLWGPFMEDIQTRVNYEEHVALFD